jgi:hypothetical protein
VKPIRAHCVQLNIYGTERQSYTRLALAEAQSSFST